MDDYITTIGLEIHAELKTQTKMFCDSKNDPDEKSPNINVCPICLGYPGTLPTVNKEAVRHVLKVGVALGGEISDFTEFDRKNYFYPDIPKGYQISQYKYPLVRGGKLNGVDITRIHLEEDTARSTHEGNVSFVDFNRAGIPLMELVTEPAIHSAQEASFFAKELQLLLQYLGAGEANMEKGEMRVEANVSVGKRSGTNKKLGTKVEIKNLNSFKAVEKAISYEVNRHIELLERGEAVIQETRGWDETEEHTFSQRSKEESHDYRYFPDPDLPKFKISEVADFDYNILQKSLPELPWDKRLRYINTLGIREENVETFVRFSNLSSYFEKIVSLLENKKYVQIVANYLTSDLMGLVNSSSEDMTQVDLNEKISVASFSSLVKMVLSEEISSRGAKDIIKLMFKGDRRSPESIAEENDLYQKSATEDLMVIVKKVISDNPSVASEYKKGKISSLQFLVGQGMKESGGSANPEILKKLLIQKLS